MKLIMLAQTSFESSENGRQSASRFAVTLGMGVDSGTASLLCLMLLALAPAPALEERQAPGVRIERAPPDAEADETRARLRQWRRVYVDRLALVRRSAAQLFIELERSSLATLTDRCSGLLARVDEIDRAALFPSPDIEIDRMLFGSLERYRAGAAKCLVRRFVFSYRLLLEARAGLEWVDRRIDRRLSPPVRLPGLDPPGEGR